MKTTADSAFLRFLSSGGRASTVPSAVATSTPKPKPAPLFNLNTKRATYHPIVSLPSTKKDTGEQIGKSSVKAAQSLAASTAGDAAGAAGAGAGGAGGLAAGAFAVVGLITSFIGSQVKNSDVSHAGQATTAAAPIVGAALGSTTSLVALPTVVVSAGFLANSIEEERQVRSDLHSAKILLGDKVPSALSRLNAALSDAAKASRESSTATLITLSKTLNTARLEFNSVDHAFKPGGVRISEKSLKTGLDMSQVKPQLNALAIATIRVNDELGRRGINGAAKQNIWIAKINQEAYDRLIAGVWSRSYFTDSEGNRLEDSSLPNQWLPSPKDMLEWAADYKSSVRFGHFEEDFRQMLARWGYTSKLPGFGDGVPLPSRSHFPREPIVNPAWREFNDNINQWVQRGQSFVAGGN